MPSATPNTLSELRGRFNAGEKFSFLYFWGHRPRPDGRVSSSCLSQWFEAPFQLGDLRYPTAEHFMMAEKARLFGDEGTLAKILSATTPAAAKALGRQIKGYDESAWKARRFQAIVEGNLAKFGQNQTLATFLQETGTQVLVEASPVDPIWGIGLAKENLMATDQNTWQGSNLLGFALGAVRDQLA
jgi:hypothetical protein